MRQHLPIVGAAIRNIVIFVAVLAIPLTAAQNLGLSPQETSGWILALYGLPGLLSLALVWRYRMPLLLTGNLFFVIFISGLGDSHSFPELMGAALLAGAGVLAIGLLGLTQRLAGWIPVPIMFGLLAGAVMPFVAGIFSDLGESPIIVGGTTLTYFVSRRLVSERLPPILPAIVVGTLITASQGSFTPPAEPAGLLLPRLSVPVLSVSAILTATPVFIVLITLQANLPSIRFLHSEDFEPPARMIDAISGIGTMVGSFVGPTGVSLSLPATSLLAGPEAGEPELRHRGVVLVALAGLLLGVFAGFAAQLAELTPMVFLMTLAGLCVIDILRDALQRITEGPLLLGPLVAFAVALSEVSFLGFGSYFWSLVIGTAVSLLLEWDGYLELRRR